MIAAIDTRVLAAHQWLVDFTGKDPRWLIEQCAYALLVSGLLRAMLADGVPGWWRFMAAVSTMMLAFWIYLDVKRPLFLAATARSVGWRRVFLVMTAAFAPFVYLSEPALSALRVANDLAFLGSFYFAACRPPAPRPPKRRLTLAGGDA